MEIVRLVHAWIPFGWWVHPTRKHPPCHCAERAGNASFPAPLHSNIKQYDNLLCFLPVNVKIVCPVQEVAKLFSYQLCAFFNLAHDLVRTEFFLVWPEHLFRDVERLRI